MTLRLSIADFTFSRYAWGTDVILPSWAGFQSRAGAYASVDAEAPSDGRTSLIIFRDEVEPTPVTDADLECANWTVERERDMSSALLQALVVEYAQIRPRYARFLGAKFNALMPQVDGPDGFRDLIGLATVFVHPPTATGRPHVGLLFGCTWDVEHGLGAIMHGTDVLKFGGADAAFNFYPPDDPGST